MYRKNSMPKTTLYLNDSTEGESIEQKVERIVENKEPITDGAGQIYTERKHGVIPETNPRTDRFEYAVEGMDKIHRNKLAEREKSITDASEKLDKINKDIQDKKGTDNSSGTEVNSGTSE